ncbi:MAG: hypothetical protein PF961_00565 [Planctomycetota bacterium]|jgi:hypothetical protein|nr:hypothetical protein [Planctomycetota bacterium]
MTNSRSGAALFVAIMTVTIVLWLLFHSTQTIRAASQFNDLTEARHQAMYAAEAVAALKETALVEIAASNDLIQLETMSEDGEFWRGETYFANCLVRWRIEPVVVTFGGEFTLNPPADPTKIAPDKSEVDPDHASQEEFIVNRSFYNYRVATEAYYLTDAYKLTTSTGAMSAAEQREVLPWNASGQRQAVAQASRVVQLQLNSLFRYALFYAGIGPEGDIEFHNGPLMDVLGSVHSNGAIYLGGDDQSLSWSGGAIQLSSDFRTGDNGGVNIGSSSTQVSCVGISGIYRTMKHPLYAAWQAGVLNSLDPYKLPFTDKIASADGSITHPYAMSGTKDVNAGNGTMYKINGTSVLHGETTGNDSRTPDAMTADFGELVRDGVTRGASVVRTLSNIPSLGGRPFETERLVSENRNDSPTVLYVRNPSQGDYTLTIIPNTPPKSHYADPQGINGDPDDDYLLTKAEEVNVDPSLFLADYEIGNVSLPLYYTQDPATIDASMKGDRNDFSGTPTSDGGYTIASGTWSAGSGTIPGLPSYISTTPSTFPVIAGAMPRFALLKAQTATDRKIFVNQAETALSDVTDPLSNPFDAGRSWYQANGSPWLDKAILSAGTGFNADPLLERGGSGDEHDGFNANELLGAYSEWALLGGSTNDPGIGLFIRERPRQLMNKWPAGFLPTSSNFNPIPTWANIGADLGTSTGVARIVFEAENASVITTATGMAGETGGPFIRTWVEDTSTFVGASGSVMRAMPNNTVDQPRYHDTADFLAHSPTMAFEANISAPVGTTFYGHVRGANGPGDPNSDNSIHIGIVFPGDTAPTVISQRVNLPDSTSLEWEDENNDGNRIQFTTPVATGNYRIVIWMREDGSFVDKFVFTADPSESPSGVGPASAASTSISVQGPYGGTPLPIAATGVSTIQAEHYDTGGINTAYTDVNATNDNATSVRTSGDDHDLFIDGTTVGVGSVEVTDSYEYTVDIADTAYYTITAYGSAPVTGGGTMFLQVAGTPIAGLMIPQTADLTTYASMGTTNVQLAQGTHTFRVSFNTPGIRLDRLTFEPTSKINTYPEALAAYLKSQYLVYFGFRQGSQPIFRDVTDAFFDFGVSSASDATDLVAYESWVRNRRETGFNGWMYALEKDRTGSPYNLPDTLPGGNDSARLNNFHVNWLTVNVDHVCSFLRTTLLKDVDPLEPTTSTTTVGEAGFNGMIYVGRTRRSETWAPTNNDTAMFTRDYKRDESNNTLLPHGYHPIWNPDWFRAEAYQGQLLSLHWGPEDYVLPSHGYEFAAPTDEQLVARARVRTGNGPHNTFQNAVRLTRANDLNWGGIYDDGVTRRYRGLTFVTGQPLFLWKNFNVTVHKISDGTTKAWWDCDVNGNGTVTQNEADYWSGEGYELPPCAVFTDNLSVLSKDWTDAGESNFSSSLQNADTTWYNTSVITNNVPTYIIPTNGSTFPAVPVRAPADTDATWQAKITSYVTGIRTSGNIQVAPSGGPHNLIRYLENWGGDTWHIRGSVVVMGIAKYTNAEAGWNGNTRTSNETYYSPPTRDMQFNTDLFTRPGQPPFTPFGVKVVRTVQTVNVRDQ